MALDLKLFTFFDPSALVQRKIPTSRMFNLIRINFDYIAVSSVKQHDMIVQTAQIFLYKGVLFSPNKMSWNNLTWNEIIRRSYEIFCYFAIRFLFDPVVAAQFFYVNSTGFFFEIFWIEIHLSCES